MAITDLRDIPITRIQDESLDVAPYVESLSQFIMECDMPMTVAIQGDWGSGKTSMMNLISACIEERYPNRTTPIWFNTWQYSQFRAQDQLGISLLSRFATEVAGQSSGGEKVLKMIGGIGKLLLSNAAFIGTMAATGSAEGAKDAKEAVASAFHGDFIQSLTELRNSINEITEARLKRDGKDRFVVFIDDLDRLVPERAVELLEVFKLFLDVPGCVFVLACDYQVIAQGLQRKFGIGEGDLKGKSFFDKIIQLPFSMPVSQYDTRRYTGDLLERIGIVATGEDLEKYRRLISASVGLNPRSMKRLVNSFMLISLVAERKGILKDTDAAQRNERQRILLACLCLQTAFEPLYRHLVGMGKELSEGSLKALQALDPADPGVYQSLIEEMGGENGATAQRLPVFMEAFMDAIQLASDGKDRLSDSELHNLAEILTFSSITATTTLIQQQDDRASLLLKEMLRHVAEQINNDHAEHLSQLDDVLKARVISRKGRAHGFLETESGLLLDRKRISLFCEFDDRNYPPSVSVYLSATNFPWLNGLLEKTIGKDAPYQDADKADFEDKTYYVGYRELSDDESLEDRLNIFEELIKECIGLVLLKLAELKRQA